MRERSTIRKNHMGRPTLVHRKNGSALLEITGNGTHGENEPPVKHKVGAPNKEEEQGSLEWIPWGIDDNFPRSVIPMIRKSTVGNSALHLLTKDIYGQDLFTYKLLGYDDNGQPIKKFQYVPEWETAIRQSNFNAVRLGLIQDYCYWGWNVPEIRLNGNKTKVWGFDYHRAANCRFAPRDNDGNKTVMLVNANFPRTTRKDSDEYPIIDFIRYPDQIAAIREDLEHFSYVMPQFWLDVINDDYPVVYWDSARSSGHMGIATSIPVYRAAMFKNQMSLKFHIQIPWEWIMRTYPDWAKLGQDVQDDIIDELYNDIINCLTGAENAEKALLSFYEAGKDGKATGGWKIDPIDDKMRNEWLLPDAAAANTEINLAFLVNPATTGQGNTGGTHSGGANNGGSNIREAQEVRRSGLKVDRDICYSFFEFFKMYNGIDPEIRLGSLDTVLTTLDTGSNTTKVTS